MSSSKAGARRRLNLDSDKKTNKTQPPTSSPLHSPSPTKGSSKGPTPAAAVTPQKKRRSLSSFLTPENDDGKKKKKKKARYVTPQEKIELLRHTTPTTTPTNKKHHDDDDDKGRKEPYIPIHIHQNLSYLREGQSTTNLTDAQRKTYNFVKERFVIPKDFETSRLYGPLSGVSFEERVLAAFTLGRLEKRIGDDVDEDGEEISMMCSYCGEEGHMRRDCPGLI